MDFRRSLGVFLDLGLGRALLGLSLRLKLVLRLRLRHRLRRKTLGLLRGRRCLRGRHLRHRHRKRRLRKTRLQLGDTLGKRLKREVCLRAGDAREGNLEHELLVGGCAHLARCLPQDRQSAGGAVSRTKGLGLARQADKLLALGVYDAFSGAERADHVNVAQARGQLARELQKIAARFHKARHLLEESRHIARGKRHGNSRQRGVGGLAEEVADRSQRDTATRHRRELLEARERVAHAAMGLADHEVQSLAFGRDALASAYVIKVRAHVGRPDRVELEALDARENRCGNLLRVGRAEDEDDAGRRLFKGLEQGVESLRREHVDLVHDINLVIASHGREVHAANDGLAHVVDAGIGCGVDFDDVGMVALGDELALLAGAVGQASRALAAEQGLCEDARHRGLACAARAAEKIGMAHRLLDHRALKRRHHMLLANHV